MYIIITFQFFKALLFIFSYFNFFLIQEIVGGGENMDANYLSWDENFNFRCKISARCCEYTLIR